MEHFLPSELVNELLKEIEDEDLCNVACINTQYYQILCHFERKKKCLLLCNNLDSESKIKSIMESSRIFNSLEILSHGESLEVKSAVVLDVVEKFGADIINAKINNAFHTRTLLKVLELLPNIRSLHLCNISATGTNYEENLACVKFLTTLETLELNDCNQNITEILSELPRKTLKKLVISDQDPQELAGLIAKQSSIQDMSIFSFDDDFNFPGELFTNLKLKRFVMRVSRDDNQANYGNMEMFLTQQQEIHQLNFHKTRIGGGCFDRIVTMPHLQHLQLNIAFVPIENFRRIGAVLKQLKTLNLYNEVEMLGMNIEFVSALSTHSLSKLRALKLQLGRFEYPLATLDHFRNIGRNAKNLKSFRMQAQWSYELLHAVFKHFNHLRELKATFNGYEDESDEEDEDDEDEDDLRRGEMTGDINCLYEVGLHNDCLESLYISHRMQSDILIFRMLTSNFPNLKEIHVTIG